MKPAAATLLLSLALAGCQCGEEEGPLPPSVLLVTIDTWRADHLDSGLTPNIHALAEEGLRFDNAFSPIGLTSPAHASLFTGFLPWNHGMRANNHHGSSLTWRATTLAEQLRMADWRTAAFVSAYPAGPEGGLAQGFQVFDGPDASERPGDEAVSKALGWLGTVPRGKPWMLWVHLFEPHGPYAPPEEDSIAIGATSSDRDRYAAEVHAADRMLGPLLDEARERGSFIAVTSDHGEVLDEEVCSWQHERSIHQAVLRVPLVIAGPGVAAAVREEWVGIVDVAPTLLELLEFPALQGVDGRSLLEESEGRDHWLAESGMCESDCAPGCAPEGIMGRDRTAFTEDWRVVDRPGRGAWAEGAGAPLPDEWSRLLAPIVRFAEPTPTVEPYAQEAAKALGYEE